MSSTQRRIAFISMGLVVAGSLAGCGAGSTAKPSGVSTTAVGSPFPMSQHTPNPRPVDAPTPPPESSPRPEAPTSYENSAAPVAPPVTLDASGWLAGFKVAVKGASLDPTAHLMILRVTLTNTSQVDAPLSQNDNEISIDPGEGSGLVPMQSVTPNAVVVAGSTATSTLRFFAPPGISLDKAILVLGKPADPLCLVALNNAADAGSVATSSGS